MAVKILQSPLAGTAGVLIAIGLLAIPLRHLTSHRQASAERVKAVDLTEQTDVHAVLRLRALSPARSIRVTSEDGATLLDLTDVAAGESEHDTRLVLHDESVELLLDADLGDSPSDTALFLTVMPDGRVEQTRYVIGNGTIHEPLRYDWHSH